MDKAGSVHNLFTPVAPTYRAINRAMTFGLVAIHDAVKADQERQNA